MPKSIDLGTILRVFYEKKKKKNFFDNKYKCLWGVRGGGGGESWDSSF